MSNKVKSIFAALFLLCINVIFFYDVLFSGKTLFTGDNISLNIPGKILLRSIIANKELPLWNPYLFSGMPFLADINFGVLAPINFLYFIFDPFTAHTFNVVIAIWLIGFFMFLFYQSLKLSFIPAIISAVIFMFSGSVFINTLNTAILNVVMWLPLIMWSLEIYLQKDVLWRGLLIASLCSLQLFSGHIQYTYYTWLFMVIYIVWRTKPFSIIKLFKHVCIIFFPILLLSAIQIFPFLEFTQLSTRPQQNLSYAEQVSFVSFIRLIFPNFFGVLKDGTSWGATADISGFIGIIPLFLIIFTFVFRKINSKVIFFFISSIVFLLMSLGSRSPIYLLAYYLLPFYARFRSPSSILILYSFCLSIVAGFGFKYLFQCIDNGNIKTKQFFRKSILVFSICFIISLLLKLYGFEYLITSIKYLQQITHLAFFTRFLEYSSTRTNIIYGLWINNLLVTIFFLFLFSAITYYSYMQKNTTFFHKLIFIFLVLSELMFFSANLNVLTNKNLLTTPKSIITTLKEDVSPYRILTLKDGPKKPPFADPNYFVDEAIKSMTFLQSDTNLFHLIQSVDGYSSLVYRPYAEYVMNRLPTDPTGIDLINPTSNKINELNVKYILTAGRYLEFLKNTPQFILINTYCHPYLKRTFYMFENLYIKPRAELVDKKNGLVTITSYKMNEVQIKTETNTPSIVLLRDVYYPGWKALVNNQFQEIKPISIFRSVHVPAGTSYITMMYQPLSVIMGSIVSATSWFLLFCYFLFLFLSNIRKKYVQNSIYPKARSRNKRIKPSL